jgi:predicted short-subunit dehydrogenase-like oxidoreductase (DUF2520 family)
MTKKREPNEKPSVSIIGAGRMGGALAVALSLAGYPVLATVARRLSRARRIAEQVGPRTIALSKGKLSKLPPSDLILIATPDDMIESVAAELADAQKELPETRTVLHTSGALSSTVLASLAAVGFHTGSLHPLVSISDLTSGSRHLRGNFFCVEGHSMAQKLAGLIVSDLGGQAFSVKPKDKALYHAAAVLSSGHLTALFDIAIQMLKDCGLSRRQAREILLPLVQSTVTNLSTMEPAEALTGTFARGDVATVKKHLAAIQGESSDALAAYIVLGRRSLSLAKRKIPTAARQKIAALLDRAGEGIK